MANRFWVGGTANWDATVGTKWALTSGGAGGQAVPTAADDVFFDAASGAVTCTVSGNRVAKSITCTGFTGTLAGTGGLTISGSLTLVAGMTLTYTGTATFNATGTITSGGKTLSAVTINGVGITVTIGDSFTSSGVLTLTNGTLNVNNQTVTTSSFSSTNANTRAIQFGTGNITITGTGTAWTTATATNLTYTGTPTVNLTGSTTMTITAGTTSGADTNAFNFNRSAGTALTVTTGSFIRNLDFTGFTGTWSPSTATCSFFENLTLVSGMTFTTGTGAWTFRGTSGVQTITSAGKTIGPITINNTGTSVQLIDNTTGAAIVFTTGTLDINSVTTSFTTSTIATGPSTIQGGTLNLSGAVTHTSGTFTLGTSGVLTAAGAYTFTAGTLALGSNTLTALTFSSSNSNTRAIQFGTGQITLTGNNATVWNNTTSTNFSTTGTIKIVSTPTTFSGTRTFALSTLFNIGPGSGNEISFGNTGGDSVAFTGSVTSLDFTGYLGTWAQGANTLSITTGNLTLDAGMTCTASTGVISFTATSGTQTITSAGKTLNPITINGVGGTVQLADNASINGQTTLVNGTLNLNNNTLSTTTFVSNNSNIRAIQFGTGNITTTGSGTVWNITNTFDFTYTGTPTVNISNNSATATTVIPQLSGGTEANVLDFNFTTGTYALTLTGIVGSLNFTGFTGTWSPSTNTHTFYGDLTLVSGMTFTTGTGIFTWANTSGTGSITSGGKTLNPVTRNGTGGTTSLADTANISGAVTVTLGTFTTNNQPISSTSVSVANSASAIVTMGSSTWTLSGSGTVWQALTSSVINADTSTIVLSDTTTTNRLFAGGGKTYNNLTIGGATGISQTSITGANTFATLASTKTVAHTIKFSSGNTTTVANWTITGTIGNVVTINSVTPGTQATLTKTGGGVISGIDYLSIQDSNATPADTWYAGANSTNVSNNTGWIFSAFSPSNGNFFLVF